MLDLPIPIEQFISHLLIWYEENKRDLPWRKNSDPYQIWISEIMLQQTQVATVIPFYETFLKAYPTLESLAQAKESDILSSWSGLGYYRRARNLHEAAQIVKNEFGGYFPKEYRKAIQLPGIGRYTAGAILSIAYGEPLPILDGNVSRFLTRYLCLQNETKTTGARKLWDLLARLVETPPIASQIADFNQALMEVGSLVCAPRHPHCERCPLQDSCGAYNAGLETTLPKSQQQKPLRESHYTVALVSHGDSYLFTQSWQDTFLHGFWEFPRVQGRPTRHTIDKFLEVHGLNFEIEGEGMVVNYRITSRKLTFHTLWMTLVSPPSSSQFAWTKPGVAGYPTSPYVNKILETLDV